MEYKIYLAGPITGLSYKETMNWRETIKSNLPKNYITFNPMRAKEELAKFEKIEINFELTDPVQSSLCSSRGVITRDFNDVKNCDAIIANLSDETKVSIGTVMEIAWAKAFQIPVIAIVSQQDKLYHHPMINECVGFRVKSLTDAIEILTTLLPIY